MPDPAMSEPMLELRTPLDGKALGSRKDGSAVWLAALPHGAVLHVLAPPASATALTAELTALGAARSLTVRPAAPGQWYLLGDSGLSAVDISAFRTALAGKADILDQSHARARILVGGSAVRRMLAKGVGLDLHPDLFAVGHSAATMIGHLSVLLTRTEPDEYEILVTRSFAEALWDDLETMAREYL